MHTRIHAKRWGTFSLLLATLLLLPLFQNASPAVAQSSEPLRIINGIEISGRFLQQWSAHGSDRDSLLINGLPLTPARPEISLVDGKSYITQWFERARYELHPEYPPPHDIQLALLGSFIAEGRGKLDPTTNLPVDPADTPFAGVDQPTNLGPTNLWFPETRHTLSGPFLSFWQRYGGLQQFGFPLSEPFTEPSPTDGKIYTIQYFERNRFGLHPDEPPPYDVQLGLLGSQLHRLNAIPAADLPIAPPPGITSARDTYIEGSLQEPDTLFCNEANTLVGQRFCQAITFNDRLVGTDHLGNPFPLAAWYVPTFENGGTYYVGTGDDRHLVTKFKLRPGILWSDGVELTSHDAVFSYKLILDDPNSVIIEPQLKLASVDNPDKYTVIYNWLSLNQAGALIANPEIDQNSYNFLKPFLDLNRPIIDPDYIYIGTVHPRHVLASIPIDKIQESPQGQNPTGYGPYVVQEWKQGESMTLVANPNYNLTAKPLITTIVSRFNPDVRAQVNAFLRIPSNPLLPLEPIDGIASEGFVVPPDQSEQIRKAGGVVSTMPAAAIEQLQFKFNFEPFKDIRVRRAITHAIDRQKIISTVYRSSAGIINSPVPLGIFHSLENPDFAITFPDLAVRYRLPIYSYDPAAANRLLDEAGWKPPCGDPAKCVREKDGSKLTFDYTTTRNFTRQAIQALVAADLRRIGLDPHMIGLPTAIDCFDSPIDCRTYILNTSEIVELAYATGASTNFDHWETDSYTGDPNYYVGPNSQYYTNPKVDTANRLFKTSVSATERAEQSAIIQVELMNDAAIVPLAQRANIEIYTNKLKNRKTPNSTVPGWWNITQWYFDN